MTDTATEPAPTTTETATDTWADQLEQLRARYKHVREPILFALNILLHDPEISLDDAKAQANLHGVRITAASVAAAQRLLQRQTPPAVDGATKRATATAPRRARPAAAPLDVEALLRATADKIQAQADANAERLRDAVRRAIAMLQAAVEG
jgi:hypothetical protein